MRGKVPDAFLQGLYTRITPAYAGKSMINSSMFLFLGDHPRLCGEKEMCTPILVTVPGSPPPMRGKAYGSRYYLSAPGITPAYAGKSSEDTLKFWWD